MADSSRKKRVPRRHGQSTRIAHNNGKAFHAAWKKEKKRG